MTEYIMFEVDGKIFNIFNSILDFLDWTDHLSVLFVIILFVTLFCICSEWDGAMGEIIFTSCIVYVSLYTAIKYYWKHFIGKKYVLYSIFLYSPLYVYLLCWFGPGLETGDPPWLSRGEKN